MYGLMFLGSTFFFVRLNHVAEYVFVGLVVIWVAERLYSRHCCWHSTFLDWPLFLFLVWIFLSSFFAIDPDYSFNEWRKALPRFLIFWFAVNAITTESQVRSVLFASSLGLGTMSLIEVAFYFWNGGHVLDLSLRAVSRAGALTGSSQWLGTFLVIGLPLVFLGICAESTRTRRVVYFAIGTAILGAVFLVHTRATWLAISTELMVFGLLTLKPSWRFRSFIVMVSLVGVLLFFGIDKLSTVNDSQVTSPATLQLRLNTWWFAITRIVEEPVIGFTGIGYGKHSFNMAYPNLGPGFHTHIHNMFLARAIQLGIPGLLLFVWIFWMVVVKSFRAIQFSPHLYVGKIALAMLLATTGLMVRNLLDDMFIGSVVYVYCLFLGLLCVTLRLHGIGSEGGNISITPNPIPVVDGR